MSVTRAVVDWDINALGGITHVGGNLGVYYYNDSGDFGGLNGITHVGGNVTISSNAGLESLSGLSILTLRRSPGCNLYHPLVDTFRQVGTLIWYRLPGHYGSAYWTVADAFGQIQAGGMINHLSAPITLTLPGLAPGMYYLNTDIGLVEKFVVR